MQELFFHGTRKEFLGDILKNGMKIKPGRATFITNPNHSVSFSSKQTRGTILKIEDFTSVIKEGVLLVIKDPGNQIHVAKDSELILKNKGKIITGWPNRFKTEQHGYYPKTRTTTLDKKYIVAAFSYNIDMIKCFDKFSNDVIDGKINSLKPYIQQLTKILSDKKIQLVKPKVRVNYIASEMANGLVRNIVLKQIRQACLSLMHLSGWKIVNKGNHPVKLKNKIDTEKQIFNIFKIIHKEFMAEDVKQEFFLLTKQ